MGLIAKSGDPGTGGAVVAVSGTVRVLLPMVFSFCPFPFPAVTFEMTAVRSPVVGADATILKLKVLDWVEARLLPAGSKPFTSQEKLAGGGATVQPAGREPSTMTLSGRVTLIVPVTAGFRLLPAPGPPLLTVSVTGEGVSTDRVIGLSVGGTQRRSGAAACAAVGATAVKVAANGMDKPTIKRRVRRKDM